MSSPVRLAFVCVQNAGRSQMSTAFAERERAERGLEDEIEIRTGGTDPAEHVHEEVIEVMSELGFDLSDREPKAISDAELESCDYVATMGCSTLSLDADSAEPRSAESRATPDPDVRDWALDDPDGQDLDAVRAIRDDIEERVAALFDEIQSQSFS